MSVSLDADFGQMYYSRITSVTVYCLRKLTRHFHLAAPLVHSDMTYRLFSDEIAIIDDDGNFC